MKVVILAGGYGTRLSEETINKPKPMVEIGGKPILWHIMKIYSYYNFNEFIICTGYKGNIIKDFFTNYLIQNSDVTFDIKNNNQFVHNDEFCNWKVTVANTGLETNTGGRIKKISKYLNGERFMLTYGDGVANINLKKLLSFHLKKKKTLTITAVLPQEKYGILDISENHSVYNFEEKKKNNKWINGGFFVCEPSILKYIEGEGSIFEIDTIKKLISNNQVSAMKHTGFWKCMDNLKDKNELEKFCSSPNPPWQIWR